MYSRLPVANVIYTPDMEVMAITISSGCAASTLNPLLNVLSRVRYCV
jgi:hypothetical protein